MKRLGLVFVAMLVVMGMTTKTSARTGAWHFYDGGYHWVDYGRSYGHYRSRPVVQVGGGYGSGPAVVDYDYGYGCYPKNAQNSYPSGSLLSGLLGVPSYNEEKYWAYQNRLLDIGEKQSQQSGSSHPYISDPQLLEQAKQRGKLQHLEDANKRLQQQNAELKRLLTAKTGK